MTSKVYYSKEITPEKVVELYQKLGKVLTGKVAVKLHSGEEGNRFVNNRCQVRGKSRPELS